MAGEVDAVVGHLWRLGEELGKATPARRREVFRHFVDRIEPRFDRVKQGKKTICPLQPGEIYLRTGKGTIFGSVNRGDRRFTFAKAVDAKSLLRSMIAQTFAFTADEFFAAK